MPLEVYQRGKFWYARGRVEYNGTPITDYDRWSTGSSTEAGAREWVRNEEDRQRRRHLVGDESIFTVADAVMIYPASPKAAKYLIPIIAEVGNLPVHQLTPLMVRNLGPKLYPTAAADTWWRQVVTPLRAVINNAHDLGKCAPIKVKAYKDSVRIAQDQKRGKKSRVEVQPFTRDWLEAFCRIADPYNSTAARLIFESAGRADQVFSLTPKDLDLKNRRFLIKAQKGHEEQWVTISHQMMVELANLPPKKPVNRKTGEVLEARVFGYATRGGYMKAWKTICKKAGIPYLSAHSGRHGFYTELRVRQGVDPITAAHAGRWKNASLPDARYAHVETDQAEIRERIRTKPAQADSPKQAIPLQNKG